MKNSFLTHYSEMMTMIFKIICGILIAWLILRMLSEICTDFILESEAKKQKTDDDGQIRYADIDDISELRERLRLLEDLITSCEAYAAGEHEKSIRITWHDATGKKHYDGFVSAEFLEYAYRERKRLRCALRKKIATIQN